MDEPVFETELERALYEALEKCREAFAEYVRIHRQKLDSAHPATEHRAILRKIARNRDMADMCIAALARTDTNPEARSVK